MWTDTRYNYQKFIYLVLVTKKMGIFVGIFLLCFLLSAFLGPKFGPIPMPKGVSLEVITDGGVYSHVGTYIIGGQDVEKGQFPWQIMLKKDGDFICGGTILSEWFVMTAAHCISGDPTSYSVVAGDQDLLKKEKTEQRVGVIEAYVHDKFNVNNQKINDIALVKLEAPLTWSDGVRPTDLSDADFDKFAVGNPDCWVVGYGLTSQGMSFGPPSEKMDLTTFAINAVPEDA